MFSTITSTEIRQALEQVSRQYLAGNLSRPQVVAHYDTSDLEIGITSYSDDACEQPHFHTQATEYQYMLSGWTQYLDTDTGEEHEFRAGDFYVIEPGTTYAQRSKRGQARRITARSRERGYASTANVFDPWRRCSKRRAPWRGGTARGSGSRRCRSASSIYSRAHPTT